MGKGGLVGIERDCSISPEVLKHWHVSFLSNEKKKLARRMSYKVDVHYKFFFLISIVYVITESQNG